MCSQAGLQPYPHPIHPSMFLPIFFNFSSPVMFTLQSPLLNFPLPILQWRRGWTSARLLRCVLPPGLPTNYWTFWRKEMRVKRRKWRVQPLVAPSIAFTRLLIELTSLSTTSSFLWVHGNSNFLSLTISSSAQPTISFLFIPSTIVLNLCSQPVGSYSIHLHPSVHIVHHSVCHLPLPFFPAFIVLHMTVKAAQTHRSMQVNTKGQDHYTRITEQWHKQSHRVLLSVSCWSAISHKAWKEWPLSEKE